MFVYINYGKMKKSSFIYVQIGAKLKFVHSKIKNQRLKKKKKENCYVQNENNRKFVHSLRGKFSIIEKKTQLWLCTKIKITSFCTYKTANQPLLHYKK